MRILRSESRRPLDLLAVGGGLVVAACSRPDVPPRVDVWDVASGTTRHLIRPTEQTGALAFTPDGQFLFVAELRAITVRDATTWEPAAGPTVRLGHPAFALSPDSRTLLVTEAWNESGRVTAWDLHGLAFREAWHDGPHHRLWFDAPTIAADGRVAVIRRPQYGDRPMQTIQVRDGATGKPLAEIPHDAAEPVWQLAFTTDGSKLLARCHGRSILVFDPAIGAPAGELRHPGRHHVTGLAVHPGGRAILTTRTDGTARLWDPVTLRELRAFDWKSGRLASAAFSPDGSLAAAGTEDGQVIVWDVDL